MTFSKVRGRGFLAILTLLVTSAVMTGACDDGTEPTPSEEDGTINVTVTADASARQGVTVRLFASGEQDALAMQETASNGVATFPELEPGTYDAEIEVPTGLLLATGETARKSVTVAAGATRGLTFALVTDDDPGGEVVEIHLTSENRFDPSSVTISVGTTVRWINDTSTFHTITPSGHSEWARQEMNSSGQTFEHTFQSTGTFNYFCEPHEGIGMTGSITVE